MKISKRTYILLIAFILGLIYAVQPYSMVWNRTASIPVGLYLSEKATGDELKRGDLACFPYDPPSWAENRAYFVKGLRLCKHVTGLPGDVLKKETNGEWTVTTPEGKIKTIGVTLKNDSRGNPLPQDALKEGVISKGQILMTAPPKNSMDSRYLGPIPLSKLNTRIYPIWTD